MDRRMQDNQQANSNVNYIEQLSKRKENLHLSVPRFPVLWNVSINHWDGDC